MATITFRGNPAQTNGTAPAVGTTLPAFMVTPADLTDINPLTVDDKPKIFNIFPSIDTGVCALSAKTFNQRFAEAGATIFNLSMDTPFALLRYCTDNELDMVQVGSFFRHPEDLDALGIRMVDSPIAGLASRVVIVVDGEGVVRYVEQVPEIGQEPDYDAAIQAVANL